MLHHLHRLSLIAGVTGFIANLAQVALFRFFMGQFYGTEIHLGLFLSIWLLGIASGGLLSGKISIKPAVLLSLLLIVPIIPIMLLYFGIRLLPDPNGSFLPFAPVAIFMLSAIFPVSMLIGMLIPCLIRLSHKSLGYFYSLEAAGSFAGGIFFSLLLGGTADSILCLLALPVLPLATITLISRKKALPALTTLLLAPLVWNFGPQISNSIDNLWWQKMHGQLKLERTLETPYQRLQLADYHEQKSLFSNGILTDSWPATESVESRVHSFVSVLARFDNILLVGAPSAETIAEFLKYPGCKITLLENDAGVIELLGYGPEIFDRIKLLITDSRHFLNSDTVENYDAIMLCPVSPVTLVGNRLFTLEAFRAMKRKLKPHGILSLQVEGSENYLGNAKEKILLSTWQALKSEFSHCVAMPGSAISFFASDKKLSLDAKELISRFSSRNIQTSTFFPMSFHNILMPFRVAELNNWLARDHKFDLNTDAQPNTFMQQLELWNVYSGTSLNKWLAFLQNASQTHLYLFFLTAGIGLMLLPALFSASFAARNVIAGGVAVSGATGLFSEIILILLYQNRHGAAYQMTALFFGLYMLGLASGAMTFGHLQQRAAAIKRLKHVKLLQIAFTGFCATYVYWHDLHSASVTGLMIFLIAFLDGIEFPVADSILRGSGRAAQDSAGLLLFSDSAGAMLTGLLSGLWLLPAFGMQNCFAMLCTALSINFIGLLLFSKKIHEG